MRSRNSVSARDHGAVSLAAGLLENTSFSMKVAGLVGRPVTHALDMLPHIVNRQLARVIESAILKCLGIAIDSLEGTPPNAPSRWVPRVTTGVTGGLGGLFGAFALPIELPLTTTLMLQSIADIARHYGEELSRPEARLACLEVFALGVAGPANAPILATMRRAQFWPNSRRTLRRSSCSVRLSTRPRRLPHE